MKTLDPMHFGLFAIVCCLLLGCKSEITENESSSIGTNYFISNEGDDNNPGSIEQPWKTIKKLNQLDLSPGDSVLFKGEQIYTGTITLDSGDRATENKKIIITSYGQGRAIIDGANSAGLIANKTNNLIVRNLVFKGSGRKEGNISDGVLIENCRNLEVDSLEIHGFQHSGLQVTKCQNARITYVYAHNNGFAGIHVNGTTINDSVNYDNKNIYIGFCVAENNPGDPTITKGHSGNGILASSVDGGTIEYCEAFNNGWDMPWDGNGPVGIWIWDCTDFIIQNCIAHHNKTNPEAADGGGFDFDGGVSNSIMQYNLSYNNEGCGIGLFEFGAAKVWENNVIRYNVSQDDGIINGGSLGIWKNEVKGTMRNCEIYNNTFYNSNPDGSSIWIYNNHPGFKFYNNIFVSNGSFLSPGQKLDQEIFKGNAYWNLKGEWPMKAFHSLKKWSSVTGNEAIDGTVVGIFVDPQLMNPGKVSLTDPTRLGPERLPEFQLSTESPLIDKGLDLKKIFDLNPGDRDFFGLSVPSGRGTDIGAHEFQKR